MSRRSLSAAAACGILTFALGCTLEEIVAVSIGSVEVQPDSITVLEGETHQLTARVRDESGAELPNGDLTWSSDNPAVFLIDPITGQGQAVGPGQATIWAIQSGARGSATVRVEPGPSLAASDSSLQFFARVGGPGPDPIAVSIANGGGGSVRGIAASVQYPAGAPTGWLSVALSGTSAPTTLTVSALLGSLPPGTYQATLVVSSPDARNSPLTIPVEAAVVLDTPIIGLSDTSLEFEMEAGGTPPAPVNIRVTNQGGGTLSGLQATVLYSGVGGWLSAALTQTSTPADLIVEPDPSDLVPGIYVAEVRVTGPGALNSPVTVDVILTIDAGPVSPVHSTAEVPAGVIGAVTEIIVRARNETGYALDSGGATVVVTVSGANEAGPILATDLGDGSYSASYTPTAVGSDRVAITMNGTRLGGSPFSSLVGEGRPSAEQSTAVVPDGVVGSRTDIVVQARNAYGYPLTRGGATVVVTVSGANGGAGSILANDEGDGTYTASYTPQTAGSDVVAITMDGTPLGGSPYSSSVGAGSASHKTSIATVPSGTAGLPTAIVVEAYDEFGNRLTSGGETVLVEVSGANDVEPVLATDVGDGTYTASYTPTVAGTDEVKIKMNGKDLEDSPFISEVSVGPVSAAHSTADVPNGRRFRFTSIEVQARDAYGNELSIGGDTVVLTVSGSNRAGPTTATDEGDGTYTVSYFPILAGTDTLVITLNGTPISGSPFTSKVRK